MSKFIKSICVEGSGNPVISAGVAFHPFLPCAAASSLSEGNVTVISCESGKSIFQLPSDDEVVGVEFDETGGHLLVATNGSVTIWDLTALPRMTVQHLQETHYNENNQVQLIRGKGHKIWMLSESSWQLWDTSIPGIIQSHRVLAEEKVLQTAILSDETIVVVTYDESGAMHNSPAVTKLSFPDEKLISVIYIDEWKNAIVSHDLSVLVFLPNDGSTMADVWSLNDGSRIGSLSRIPLHSEIGFLSDNAHVLTRSNESAETFPSALLLTDIFTNMSVTFDANAPYPPRLLCSPYKNIIATVVNDSRHSIDITKFWSGDRCLEIGHTAGHASIAYRQFSRCGSWFSSICNQLGAEYFVSRLPCGSLTITDLRGLRLL